MGTLYIVATPIGNLDDITIRALRALFTVDYIASEDTRRTGQLVKSYEDKIKNQEFVIHGLDLGKTRRYISFYDEIEAKRIPEIIGLLDNGRDVALVSDSGTPLISDPGFKLVSECIKRNIKVISIPGPSSILCALTLSGLPTDQFLFLGYLPPRKNKRHKVLASLYRSIDRSIKF